ncbi:uncharacterized protein DSM5745_10188 [Aspergillus mulundensis]|uniref:Multicopper oxidase n=1 Tax=Aspergillus mulundensis TaxID=1810919 RepID=A0A3D8QMR7_9EURO|nr:Uncharacterized protein DSM5745_10188 [Aspergillus mulundensis]RDW63077.1 Uncharacterized protein DSM5745_10188 [Aspergillus mulundensis]
MSRRAARLQPSHSNHLRRRRNRPHTNPNDIPRPRVRSIPQQVVLPVRIATPPHREQRRDFALGIFHEERMPVPPESVRDVLVGVGGRAVHEAEFVRAGGRSGNCQDRVREGRICGWFLGVADEAAVGCCDCSNGTISEGSKVVDGGIRGYMIGLAISVVEREATDAIAGNRGDELHVGFAFDKLRRKALTEWDTLEPPLAAATSTPPKSNHTICKGNTATTRQQWCTYDINTDYTTIVPDTGKTREYYFNLEQITAAPDGRERFALAINGSIPGPTIEANWGDTVIVHVTNSLPDSLKNGTSIHFHGIRQYNTNPMDGVVSITQCPTAPGSTITYKWRAMQYGSSWYHSHIGVQTWEGLFGGIVIHGPASQNYDEDLGVMFLNDWDISTVDELHEEAQTVGPPTLDNGLINGTNVFGADGDANQTGWRWNTTFVEGTSYRLRLVNAAIDTHFKFMVDNHTLTVIANDLVPIQPYETTVLDIAIAQRYDIIITANQASVSESFWLRAIPQEACAENESATNIKGIIYYGNSTSPPNTTGHAYTDSCDDEDPSNLTPIVNPLSASASPFYTVPEPVTLARNAQNQFRWFLNGTSMRVDWADPSLLGIYGNQTLSTFANTSGIVDLPSANEWVYVVIETVLPIPHPIHLHGHDFVIIAQGAGAYNSSAENLIDTLGVANLPRRDTAMLKEAGHLVIAFHTDNPGAWLMHCHIGWHASEGFAMQFVERYGEIQELLEEGGYAEGLLGNCESWESYQEGNMVVQEDSGV